MKILIAFASRYGTTEKCANMLSDSLRQKNHETTIENLQKNHEIKLDNYDVVIIGGSFVVARMNKYVVKFAKLKLKALLGKKVGVFMCGMDDKWEDEIKKGFPPELLDHAFLKGYFGYEMNLDKMSPILRGMMKQSESTNTGSKIIPDNIEKFANEITAVDK
jgi:menaquinone-dependent protoporphyrinogen oxidase